MPVDSGFAYSLHSCFLGERGIEGLWDRVRVVVDQYVDWSQLGFALVKYPGNVVGVSQICLVSKGFPS